MAPNSIFVRGSDTSPAVRLIRTLAEGTVVVLALGVVVLLVGLPVALGASLLYAAVTWLASSAGTPIPAAAAVGIIVAVALLAFALARFFHWRGRLRNRGERVPSRRNEAFRFESGFERDAGRRVGA